MADLADMAFEIASEHVARGLAAIAANVPAGVAGECEECGETMPRLVGGRCGFCRDGRRPPLSFFDADRAPPATVVVPALAAMESGMTTPVIGLATRKIEFSGPALAAIEQHSAAQDIPYKQAAAQLIQLAVAAPQQLVDDLPGAVAIVPAAAQSLNAFDTVDLIDEIRRRADDRLSRVEFDAAIERAEAAEAKLAALKGLLA